jgi:PAS domain S-box-containing protein
VSSGYGDELQTLLDESVEELYEDAPVAHMSSLVGGSILRVNRTLEAWTHYSRSELVGKKRLHDLLAPGARIYYETHYAPLLQMQGEVREIALELVRADGTRLPVLMNSKLVAGSDGTTHVVRTTFLDASDRRRYERELLRARADAETRARSALALGHVDDGVLLVDPRGRIELMNAAAERIFGVTAADLGGRDATAAVAGWSEIAAAATPTLGATARAPSVVPVQRGDREQWLAVSAVDAGDGTVYTIRDVTTDRKLDQLRNELVTTVSHELRTPLTGVYGAATTLLARGESLDADARTTLLEIVVEQSQRLTAILDQMLFASRLDNDNVGVDVRVFDVDDLVGGLALPPAAAHRVIVSSTSGAIVCADVDLLRQVVDNLVDNALKYSEGRVHVRVEPRELWVRITVVDDGPGIPGDEQTRIFEKFYRLDPDQHSGVAGIGLGLYIARELVERMGGRIGVLHRDRGATLYVDVPRA